ncbi:MAG: flavodoxin [Anaerobiospirillum succiniciproducens]|uniref:flavodoxin n=1 Tax=Anaerobiospirillum succiniciproducens TaxID=13335 RepID=UPI002A74D37D|nr:flavodoxin [Anaerobiospirillum succiniciproducens]MDY2799628.1 flavodoxin [Anaerobiospirillum succiniciproducens]
MPKSPSAKKLLTATGLLCAIFAVSTPFWLFTSEQSVSVVNKNKVSTKDAAAKVDSITTSKDSGSNKSSDKVSKADTKAKNKDSDKANTADTKAQDKDSDKANTADTKANAKDSDKTNTADTKANAKDSDKTNTADTKAQGKDSDKANTADTKAQDQDSDKANAVDTKAKAKDSNKAQDKASDKVNDSDANNKESDKVKAAESKTDGKDAQGKTSNKESAAINEAKSKSSGEDKFATAAVEKNDLSESVLSEGQSIAQKPQSLADKVRDITNSRTAEDKAAYERAIKEREKQVDDAIASISGNYKIYLPNMFSEKAVVIYFSAPVSSTKINLRKDTDLSKLKIDSLSGATQVKYQDQDTFQDVSEPAMDYIANTLSKESGAQLFKVATVTTYPDNVSKLYSMSFDELSNNEYPELTDDVLLNIDEYSVIYLCYPNWWGNMPGAIYSFLAKYDLSDKIIVPVCLYEKDKFSGTTDTIATIEPNASVYSKGLLISKEECKNESNMRSKIRTFLTELSKEFE